MKSVWKLNIELRNRYPWMIVGFIGVTLFLDDQFDWYDFILSFPLCYIWSVGEFWISRYKIVKKDKGL